MRCSSVLASAPASSACIARSAAESAVRRAGTASSASAASEKSISRAGSSSVQRQCASSASGSGTGAGSLLIAAIIRPGGGRNERSGGGAANAGLRGVAVAAPAARLFTLSPAGESLLGKILGEGLTYDDVLLV